MNQNIIFEKNAEVVSIFKLDITKKLPFHYEIAHTVTTTDILGKPVEKVVYGCEIGSITVDVCDGDFIVIGKKPLYLNGMMKETDYVEVHTASSIQKNFGAYNELDELYVVDILDVFDEEEDEEEPTIKDIERIENNELQKVIWDAQHLSIDGLLEDN